MMKKWFALLLALALTLSLAGCGGGDAETSDEASGTESTESDSTEAIKIGLYTPLTGTSALVGTQEQMGVDLAVKQLNEAGGINGRQVTVVAYDDEFNAETAVKVVTRLVQTDKVDAIIGSMSSANILATADIVEEAQVLEIGCGTSATWTNAGYNYVFRGTQNAALFNVGIVDLIETMGVTKLGSIVSSTEYATTGWADVKSQLADTDVEIAVETDYMAGDTDFTGQITRIVNADLDGVLVYGATEDYGILCKQLRQMGYEGYIYGSETFASPDVREVGGDAVNGVLFACGYVIPDAVEDAATEEEKAFLEAFVEEKSLPGQDNYTGILISYQ